MRDAEELAAHRSAGLQLLGTPSQRDQDSRATNVLTRTRREAAQTRRGGQTDAHVVDRTFTGSQREGAHLNGHVRGRRHRRRRSATIQVARATEEHVRWECACAERRRPTSEAQTAPRPLQAPHLRRSSVHAITLIPWADWGSETSSRYLAHSRNPCHIYHPITNDTISPTGPWTWSTLPQTHCQIGEQETSPLLSRQACTLNVLWQDLCAFVISKAATTPSWRPTRTDE